MTEERKNMYRVPDGYFEGLKARLSEIPQAGVVVTPWSRIQPYLALVASFVAIITVGSVILKSTAGRSEIIDTEGLEYAYYIADAHPYTVYEASVSDYQNTISSEDVVQYLIASGVPVNNLEIADEDE